MQIMGVYGSQLEAMLAGRNGTVILGQNPEVTRKAFSNALILNTALSSEMVDQHILKAELQAYHHPLYRWHWHYHRHLNILTDENDNLRKSLKRQKVGFDGVISLLCERVAATFEITKDADEDVRPYVEKAISLKTEGSPEVAAQEALIEREFSPVSGLVVAINAEAVAAIRDRSEASLPEDPGDWAGEARAALTDHQIGAQVAGLTLGLYLQKAA